MNDGTNKPTGNNPPSKDPLLIDHEADGIQELDNLLPRWWVRAPLLRWTNTSTFHNLHHTRLQGNYGLFTRFWDRLFGTFQPEEHRPHGVRGLDVHIRVVGK